MSGALGMFVALIADQITKNIAESNLEYFNRVDLFSWFFGFRYVHNEGIGFGMLDFLPIEFIYSLSAGISLVILVLAIIYKNVLTKYENLFLGFIIGGALGNNIDRIRFGYVVDFLEFPYWPVFNLADTFIVIGAALLLFSFYRRERIASKSRNIE
ncbi:MAG: signal peptidase II [Kosmotoga sp.]|nr:MAG: signal peptidase II [Kosmotoga sp.]